jgi:glutathione reductase (NADPH)
VFVSFQYDLFVIGAGSGGVRASRMASSYGAKVAVAEDRYLGGTCVNVGCVPKKLFVYAAHYREDFVDARGFGWEVHKASFDWPTLRDNKTSEIERLNGIYGNILDGADVELIEGRARIVDAHTVEVNGQQYTCDKILIATGGWPFVPDFPGNEHVISSNEIFYLDQLPGSAVVVGGGYIAVEFAGILHGLGVNTHQLYRGPLFLRGFDEEVRKVLANEMSQKGIDLRFNCNVSAIEKRSDGKLQLTLDDGSTLVTDLVLYATGRKPLIADLGLENVDVALDENGAIKVNEQFQTSEPSIYALGDVIGGMELTPVALAEGMALAKNLFRNESIKVDYEYIPTAIFSQPNVGTVGLSEEQAREQYAEISVFTSQFRHLKHTLSGNDEKTFMKIIVDKSTDKVVGVHMVGAEAGEILQGIAVAMKCGATKADFDSTIGIHPTAAEEFVTMREATRS